MFIYSIFDEKAAAYMPPFFMQRDGVAYRAFGDGVNDTKRESNISAHPEDFALYKLGSFDDLSGEIVGQKPEFLVKGIALKIKV